MAQKTIGTEWKFGGLWALANIIGWGISISSAIVVTGLVGGREGELWLILPALLIGLAQWMVLARRFSLSGWFVPAFGLAWYIGLWLGWNLGFLSPEPFTMGAAGGALAGALQWLGMRRRLPGSWVWIPAMTAISLLGSWLGVAAGVSAYERMDIGQASAYAIGGAVAGAVIGVLSGAVLIRLIRQNARREGDFETGQPV
jgi:hypothetical protein